jgi:hypothetical protein
MVNQYFVIHISVLLLLDIFFECKIEETGKQPKRGESNFTRIKLTIGRQIQKLAINNINREKTSKYTKENAIREKTGDVNWKNFYINRGKEKNDFRKLLLF